MQKERARILVVDDEPEIVETLKHSLSNEGYEAIGAFTGEEALKILEKERADLVLLDIMMPGLKGTEVARIIKDKYPSVKIIVVTGYSSEAANLSKDTPLESVFIKPVNIQELYRKLSELFIRGENDTPDLELKQGIKARVLLIKAKLLFVEPSFEVYNILRAHFAKLAKKGEFYQIEMIANGQEAAGKLAAFNPDILMVNMSSSKGYSADVLSEILGKDLSCKGIINYAIDDLNNLEKEELERLTKAVETISLKNGLIELKWVGV